MAVAGEIATAADLVKDKLAVAPVAAARSLPLHDNGSNTHKLCDPPSFTDSICDVGRRVGTGLLDGQLRVSPPAALRQRRSIAGRPGKPLTDYSVIRIRDGRMAIASM